MLYSDNISHFWFVGPILDQQLLFTCFNWYKNGRVLSNFWPGKKLGVVLPACYCQIHESLHLSWWGWPVDLLGHLYNERGEVAPFQGKGIAFPIDFLSQSIFKLKSRNFFIILWNFDRQNITDITGNLYDSKKDGVD